MKERKAVLKIKDNVELFKVLPKYDYVFNSNIDGGAWTKITQVIKGEFYGFNTIKINNKTKVVEYHGRPIFNNTLGEEVKELIDAGLVVSSESKSKNMINTLLLIRKIIDRSVGNKDYVTSGEYGKISIDDLEDIVEEYK